VKIIIYLILVVIFQGCLPLKIKDRTDSKTVSASGTSTPTTNSSGAAVDSLTAFQSTVYPIAKARCVSCHIATNQPFFASNDARSAHDALISQSKINFNNIPSSRLVQRLSPENHNCWGNCSDNAKEMQLAIEKWKALMTPPTPTATQTSIQTATNTAGSTSTATNTQTTTVMRMNTVAMPIPANLPTGGNLAANFVPITFTLNSPNDSIDPNLVGATFSFDIQKFDNFSYRVKNPRILTPNTGISVSDIRLAVNGVIRPADATYSLVTATVNMGATATVLSPAAMVVLIDKGPTLDQMMVSFGSIKSGTLSNTCKNVAGFTSMVKPGFATYCNRCHSGGGFDLVSGTDAAICARALAKTDRANPANSPLIVKPNTGTNHPGGRIALPQTTIDSWINWITSER
jgi:hypothetical protein